jgi:hypothetical protein
MKPTIAASVGANAVNHKSDVVTVQSLLNRVPVEKGGPSTALKVDGLCYGKSLAAIGHFQKVGCGFKWPDQRVDPNGRTWNNLVSYAEVPTSDLKMIRCYPRDEAVVGSSFAASQSLAAAAPTAASLVQDAKNHTPLAMSWVIAAKARLAIVRSSIKRFKVYSKDEIEQARPFATHFKINIATQTDMVVLSRLSLVDKTFGRIQQALSALRLTGDPNEPSKAVAPLGGFDITGSLITIGADFVTGQNSNLKAAVLIHESAHFVDAQCGHVASERPAPNGSAITDANGKITNPAGKNYAQMDFNLAIRNAYSFAQCAAHCGLGRDQRPL